MVVFPPGSAHQESTSGYLGPAWHSPRHQLYRDEPTIGASKSWGEDVHDGMAEASRDYVELEDLQQIVGEPPDL